MQNDLYRGHVGGGVQDHHETWASPTALPTDRLIISRRKLTSSLLCTPSARLATTAMALLPSMKAGAVLTDVGSVKGHFVDAMADRVRDDVHFIPGHPIAGTENSGPESGFAELFEDRWCVLTPPMKADEKSY